MKICDDVEEDENNVYKNKEQRQQEEKVLFEAKFSFAGKIKSVTSLFCIYFCLVSYKFPLHSYVSVIEHDY